MTETQIHLSPHNGAIRVSAKFADRQAEHLAPAPAVAAALPHVAELMAGFETGRRPLAIENESGQLDSRDARTAA